MHGLGDDLAGEGPILHLCKALRAAVVAAACAVNLAAFKVGEDILVATNQVTCGVFSFATA